MKTTIKYIIPFFLFVLNVNCDSAEKELSEPEKNFEVLWKAFEDNYSLFDAKHVNWHAIYKVYRPQITPETTDDDLFETMVTMLKHLNDNHVHLRSRNPERQNSAGYLAQYVEEFGKKDFDEMMSKKPVPESYFVKKPESKFNDRFSFGWLPDNIGYFHFNGFGNVEKSAEAVDEILDNFKTARAVIIDVRRNGGGDDAVGKAIADRFADQKRLYMITKVRKGPGYSDFLPPKYWYVEPDGPFQFTKSVILLIDRTSISASDNFTLAMRVLPHVTIVGDSTSGCNADSKRVMLPNGWTCTIPFNLFLDQNGFCWEGIGIPPDIRQINSKEDIKNGKDRVVELAISLIQSGELKASPRKKQTIDATYSN